MIHEQKRMKAEAGDTTTPGYGRIPTGYRGVYAIPTTPYSVFVHQSPVYVTSAISDGKRPGRLSARPGTVRRVPFRPDAYPYASRRWSRYLMGKAPTLDAGGEG